MQNKNQELFKDALCEAMDSKTCKIKEENTSTKLPTPSKRHKKRMNRLFRERVGGVFLPFPEVDNLYERVRSKLIIKSTNF